MEYGKTVSRKGKELFQELIAFSSFERGAGGQKTNLWRIGLQEERDRVPVPVVYGKGAPASWLGVPMMSGERVVGVISVQAYRPYVYGEDEQLLLSTIADQLAAAFEKSRLFDEQQQASLLMGERVQAVWA